MIRIRSACGAIPFEVVDPVAVASTAVVADAARSRDGHRQQLALRSQCGTEFGDERRPIRQCRCPTRSSVAEREVLVVQIEAVVAVVDREGHEVGHVLTA